MITGRGPSWVALYLRLLGLQQVLPSRTALSTISRAHLHHITFENVSSIRRRMSHPVGPVPPLDVERILQEWEAGSGGAVCFEAAGMLNRFLQSLGYRSHLVLADSSAPASHQAVLVLLQGRRFLVDVGNGAPYFDPIPLDGVYEVHHPAHLSYRFRPGEAADTWIQDRWIDGQWARMFIYELKDADPAQAEASYQRHHTPGQSWVMDTLTLVRCQEDQVHLYRGREYTHFTTHGKEKKAVNSAHDLMSLARSVFRLPNIPEDALQKAF